MRKEATLPVAERMENVSFAGISIDPGENIALPEAARRPGLSAALRQKMRHGDMPEALGPTALGLLKKIMPHLSVRLSRKVVKEEDGDYEAGPGCISAT
jgi:hypothetical protein